MTPALKEETLPSRSSKCDEEAHAGQQLQQEEHRKDTCRRACEHRREGERYSQEAVQAGFLEEATQEGARELVQQRKLTIQGKFSCTVNNPTVSIKHLL